MGLGDLEYYIKDFVFADLSDSDTETRLHETVL